MRHGALALSTQPLVLLVHDAARPFASLGLVEACAKAARKGACAVAAVPVKDSIKQLRKGRVSSLKREELWTAQTPQALPVRAYMKAAQRAYAKGQAFTDEAGLAEQAKVKVVLVPSDYSNFKVTTPEDLALARQALSGRKKGGR